MTIGEFREAFLAGYEAGFDMSGWPTGDEYEFVLDRLDGLAEKAYHEWRACEEQNPANRSIWALERMGPVEGWVAVNLRKRKVVKK